MKNLIKLFLFASLSTATVSELRALGVKISPKISAMIPSPF